MPYPQDPLRSTQHPKFRVLRSARQENISYFYRNSCDEVESHLGYHIR